MKETASPEVTTISRRQTAFTAVELMKTQFEQPRWAVDGIVAEGLALLAGKPKLGKSWLCLNLAVAISSGGMALSRIPVVEGEVLYLALEDNARRLRSRLESVLNGADPPEGLNFRTDWKRLNEGGLEDLDAWLGEHPKARLVLIDTFQKVRAPSGGRKVYADDYAAVVPLQELADRRRVAIIVVHHTRKEDSEDPIDQISGSTALSGAADAILILKREQGQADAYLYLRGRDVEEKNIALSFDSSTTTWTMMGSGDEYKASGDEYKASNERTEILEFLRAQGRPMGPTEISRSMPKNINTVKSLLAKMYRDGLVDKTSEGLYFPINPVNPVNPESVDGGDGVDGGGTVINWSYIRARGSLSLPLVSRCQEEEMTLEDALGLDQRLEELLKES